MEEIEGFEEALRKKEVSFQKGFTLGHLFQLHCAFPEEGYVREEDGDWLQRARLRGLPEVQTFVRKRIESIRLEAKRVRTFVSAIDDETNDLLRRCREVATMRAKIPLSNGQLLETLSGHCKQGLGSTASIRSARRRRSAGFPTRPGSAAAATCPPPCARSSSGARGGSASSAAAKSRRWSAAT